MEPTDLNSSDDRALDTLLQAYSSAPSLPDAGFSRRVLAALPPPRPSLVWLNRRTWLCLLAAAAGTALPLVASRNVEWPTASEALAQVGQFAQSLGAVFAEPQQGVVIVVVAACVVFAFRGGNDAKAEDMP